MVKENRNEKRKREKYIKIQKYAQEGVVWRKLEKGYAI